MTDSCYETVSKQPRVKIHDPKTHMAESPREKFIAIVFGGSLLSFNAGFINIVSFLISNVLVSHTTGNITKSAIYLTEGELLNFMEVTALLPCFVFGSFVTTMLIDQRPFHLTKQYNRVFFICTILLTLASFIAIYTSSPLYAYMSTIACGMQNALTTKYSGSIIRTTHTTGMATDIGICLGRILKGKKNEVWILQVQVPLLSSFFVGGVVGALSHKTWGKHSIFICAGMYATISILYIVTLSYTKHESLYASAFGMDDIDSKMTTVNSVDMKTGDVLDASTVNA